MLYLPYMELAGARPGVVRQLPERPFTAWAPDFDAPLFDLLGMRVIVSRHALPGSVEADGFHWKTRTTVTPRVLNPATAIVHDGTRPPADAFAGTNFRSHVWLPRTAAKDSACAQGGGTAQIGGVAYRANDVAIAYTADRPSWLVLNEINAPGWWAEVDGNEVPLLQANGLFRASCVPAGSHRLSFRFSPFRLLEAGWSR